MCGCDDAEPPKFWCEHRPVARKEHRCDECRTRIIRRGERYMRVSGKWDGPPETWHFCQRCEALREAWHEVEGCWPPMGHLDEEIRECMRGDPDLAAEFGAAIRKRLGKEAGRAA